MNNSEKEIVYEDISSTSKKYKKQSAAEEYAEGAFKHIDKVVKAISFIVSIATFSVFAVIAVILYKIDSVFLILSVGLLIFGIVLSLILLFLIYALGHIITQNNDILKRL